ncbi:phosphate ABC transporter membrane protein 1 (PhoT family) [Motilibacter rhizosphaerae]|uniref:Phosphate transport system permease protein n=1 Tax=Motilibacter rhizosphaerae TaxID=598652 RepID=A0A4Q7NVC9_9ACTN|nr:phosphate ABC transporter permease subunit PstC [Motilibacter rhizosphaerae]RZS91203.1 phosphate ABC transporter membrane protein 1 (PhoT family) [Motilibacter rhizosphaerae]
MSALVAVPPSGSTDEQRRTLRDRPTAADRTFRSYVLGAGLVVLVVMVLIGSFLSLRAGEALRKAGFSFFTTQSWHTEQGGRFGVLAILVGTFIIAVVAIVVALPLSLGTALYISEYSPRGLRRLLVSLVDLMAAIPSVVYGIFGAFFLQPDILVNGPQGDGLPRWLATYFGFFPFFHVSGADPRNPLATGTVYTASSFNAGLVVGFMLTPIMSSIMREVFQQAPLGEREGAYALGATRWGMIRSVVLPYGLGGIIGGTMLGLGRALGETVAVYMIVSPVFVIQPHILQKGAISISSLIALRFGDANGLALSALMAAGLTLFFVTLAVNSLAAVIVSRSRSGAADL